MEHLFPQLRAFFDEFHREVKSLGLEEADCGDCGRCCTSPPFLMTTSDLEYALVQQYLHEQRLPYRVHFRPLAGDALDERESFLNWTCPFYTRSSGCAVYPVRPFACRIFGPLSQEPETFEGCAFTKPRVYSIPPEIPLWGRYASILRQYDFRRGYIFPDQVLFNAPALELLSGFRVPWSRWRSLPL
ncbi:MAG: YkgJ family cysteine cluster protein [Candidatus Eremiobacteraeota bacterium]|nr:YkgJ family cysteine cluster protein [Candidatus Eremiobacteraeota bacterium]